MSDQQQMLTEESAKNILKGMSIVHSPDKVKLKVANTPNFHSVEGQPDGYLVNFKAMTNEQKKEAKRLFDEGEYDQACNQNLVFKQIMKWDGSQPDFIPQKGETVEVQLGYVPNSEGQMVIRPTSIFKIEASEPQQYFSFDDEEETADAQAEDLGNATS